MKTIRLAVGLIGAVLVAGGYFASQFAYFFGDSVAYSKALDSSSVPYLALAILVGSMLLLIIPEVETPQ